MFAPRLRNVLIILAASAGLGACAGPFGYGGISTGYGNYGGYGYPYGSRYGYMPSYYGWYDNLYYPGAGYYVYDRWGNPYYWSPDHRRYWEDRRNAHKGETNVNWGEFFREHRQAAGTTSTIQRSVDSPVVTQQRTSAREAVRAERRQARQQAQSSQQTQSSQQKQSSQQTVNRSNRPRPRRARDDND